MNISTGMMWTLESAGGRTARGRRGIDKIEQRGLQDARDLTKVDPSAKGEAGVKAVSVWHSLDPIRGLSDGINMPFRRFGRTVRIPHGFGASVYV